MTAKSFIKKNSKLQILYNPKNPNHSWPLKKFLDGLQILMKVIKVISLSNLESEIIINSKLIESVSLIKILKNKKK